MPIKTNQIAQEPTLVAGTGTGPTTGSGTGAFFVLDIGGGQTEGAFTDEAGNDIQLTNAGALNLGSNNLGDLLDVTSSAPSLNDVLTWNGSMWAPAAPAGGGSGEVNTASNLGAGSAIFAQKNGVDLEFKTLVGGTNVTLSSDANTVTINAIGGGSGETNTASNLGAGSQVFAQKNGVDLEFRTLTAGSNVTITQNANDIEISSTGGGGGSSNEFSFNLAVGADIATRVAGATNVPAGWTLAAADTAGITQLGALATTLTITHNEGKIAQEISVFEETTSGPASLQGITKIDLTAQGDQKTTTSLNESGVIDLQTKTNSSRTLVVAVKFVS